MESVLSVLADPINVAMHRIARLAVEKSFMILSKVK